MCNIDNSYTEPVHSTSDLFLTDQLRKEGKLPPIGGLLKTETDPTYTMSDSKPVPALAFGLYKVPPTEEGENIISDAIAAGYRHFDTRLLYTSPSPPD